MLRPPSPDNIYHKEPEEIKVIHVEEPPLIHNFLELIKEEPSLDPETIQEPIQEPLVEEPSPIQDVPQPIQEPTQELVVEEPPQKPAEPETSKDWYNKPQGWNGGGNKLPLYRPSKEPKPGWGSIIWWGVTDKDVDPKYARKYDELKDKLRPLGIIIGIAILVIVVMSYSGAFKPSTEPYRGDGYIDKAINWLADKYDAITGRPVYKDTKVTTVDTAFKSIDTLNLVADPGEVAPAQDTAYQPVRKSVIVHDTFHYYRTDTIKKRVIIIDSVLGKAPSPKPDVSIQNPPKEKSGGNKMSHLDSILARTRGEIQ
jgi:hypothetical protein